MRRFLLAVLAIAALGIAGLVVASVVVARASSDTALAAWAEAAGVSVVVGGGAGFAVLPSPRAVAQDVRLTVPGIAEIRAARVEIVAHPATLLRGRFVSAGVRLVGAVVVLAEGAGRDGVTLPAGGVDVVDGRLVPGGGLPDLAIAGSLRGTGGDGISADLRLGADGAIALVVVSGPVAADGRRPLRIRATRGGDTVGFEGERRDGAAAGRLAVNAPALAQSLALLGVPSDLLPVRAAELTAALTVDSAGVALDGIRGQLDVGDVAGSVRWGPGGLEGRLDAGRVPFDRLVAPALALARTTAPVALDLRLAGVTWGEVELGIAAVAVRRVGTVLSAILADAVLFDGSVAGGVAIDARGGDAALSGSVRLNGVDAERLLRALGAGPAASGDLRGVVDWRLPASGAGGPAPARLVGEGRLVLTSGRVGVGVLGLDAPLPLDGLSAAFTIGGGLVTLPSIGLVSPPQRFAGRGTVDLSTGVLDIAFAPLDRAEGRLPMTGFRLRGSVPAARIEGAPVAVEGPATAMPTPALPARGERAAPPSPPMPLPSGFGRGG
ncbi:MAG: AsmA-like C-terminal region-containing protein [Rhodospirillales bacterium]